MKKIVLVSMIQFALTGMSQLALAESSDDLCKGTVDIIKQQIASATKKIPTGDWSHYYQVDVDDIKDNNMIINLSVSDVPADDAEKAKEKIISSIKETLAFKSSFDYPGNDRTVACFYQVNIEGGTNNTAAFAFIKHVPN